VVVDGTTIDYSQPIVLAVPTAVDSDSPTSASDEALAAAGQTASADQAMALLGAARTSFMRGDYAGALSQCDKAVARQPNAAVLHEFRGLALFALGRYKQAAGAIYAVLSVGPGWDWTTLSSLYPDIDVYSKQLRALEQYVTASPNAPDARFLLAYHYMTCGHADAAAQQLKAAVQLNPKDQLSPQLLSALGTTEVPQPPAPGAAAGPVDASALVGDWKASRADGATITLSLSPEGNYTWKFAQEDKGQEFSGPYTVADNLLILKKGQTPVMIGQVSLLPDGRFSFKLPGGNPSDPGLTFGK
jgi:tetratricopeptide (TPR) repeat protein